MKPATLNKTGKLLQLACLSIALVSLPACSMFDARQIPASNASESYDWPSLSSQLDKFDSWTLIGKIGVRTPDQNMTAAINQWVQNRELFDIDLSSTFFGLGHSRLVGNPVFITLLEAGEEPLSSDQPEDLLNKALGFPMPITALPYWLKGLPLPDQQFSAQYYENGLPKSMEQSNWSLSFDDYLLDQPLPLPRKIKLVQGDARITLVIKEWKHNSN